MSAYNILSYHLKSAQSVLEQLTKKTGVIIFNIRTENDSSVTGPSKPIEAALWALNFMAEHIRNLQETAPKNQLDPAIGINLGMLSLLAHWGALHSEASEEDKVKIVQIWTETMNVQPNDKNKIKVAREIASDLKDGPLYPLASSILAEEEARQRTLRQNVSNPRKSASKKAANNKPPNRGRKGNNNRRPSPT